MKPTPTPDRNDPIRRRGARRTAWILGLVAVGVYVAFMLSAVIP